MGTFLRTRQAQGNPSKICCGHFASRDLLFRQKRVQHPDRTVEAAVLEILRKNLRVARSVRRRTRGARQTSLTDTQSIPSPIAQHL